MKLAVIGCGNLARAVVLKLKGFEVHTYTPSFTRAAELAELMEGQAHKSLADIPKCDFVLLGMKPQQFSSFAEEYKSLADPESVYISLLAGTAVESISKTLGVSKVARVMSNTPALIGEGMHGLYFSNIEDKDTITKIFKASGKTIVLDSESQIDSITHLTGSGPAYLFELARILSFELAQRGIKEEEASKAIAQTLYGAAKLLLDSDKKAEELRKQVTSKAGVTEKVLESLWEAGMKEDWTKALKAGDKRIQELKG